MLSTSKRNTLNELVASSTRDELVWMSGYLAGMLASGGQSAVQSAAVPTANGPRKITLLYGTETGNAKSLATRLAAKAKQQGVIVKLASMEQYRLNDLPKEEHLFVVISTQGDGEPPAAANKFFDRIQDASVSLGNVKYAVLGLGDTSYPLFCKTGEDVDTFLLQRGAQRFVPLQKCDTDYEEDATNWFASALETLSREGAPNATAPVAVKTSGKKIHAGTILANVNLNDSGSNKETHHIEIAVEDLVYEPGDSVAIVPHNPDAAVASILKLTGIEGEKQVRYKEQEVPVWQLLKERLNIAFLPERVVKQYAGIVQQEIPETKISLKHLLQIYPVKDAAQFEQVVSILEPIAPRQYSVSSSPTAHPGEVHLTVCRDTFSVNDEPHCGLCSGYLSDFDAERELNLYVHANKRFRLPAADKDIIMVGPGTGIAPFRSFLWERDANGATGRNWLFFGEQHFTTDFLYQTEIQSWFETGVLTRFNAAFSRDQAEKVYVQHKMLEQSAELWNWLESGAYFYLCGAKEPMSVDVEATLLQIIAHHSNRSEAEAKTYLEQLAEEGRYLKDVY